MAVALAKDIAAERELLKDSQRAGEVA